MVTQNVVEEVAKNTEATKNTLHITQNEDGVIELDEEAALGDDDDYTVTPNKVPPNITSKEEEMLIFLGKCRLETAESSLIGSSRL